MPRCNSRFAGVLADGESRFFVRQDIGGAAREAGLTSEGFQSLGERIREKGS
jgi:hypothetical protein